MDSQWTTLCASTLNTDHPPLPRGPCLPPHLPPLPRLSSVSQFPLLPCSLLCLTTQAVHSTCRCPGPCLCPGVGVIMQLRLNPQQQEEKRAAEAAIAEAREVMELETDPERKHDLQVRRGQCCRRPPGTPPFPRQSGQLLPFPLGYPNTPGPGLPVLHSHALRECPCLPWLVLPLLGPSFRAPPNVGVGG